MTYRVVFTRTARRELRDAFLWIARESPRRARAWQAGVLTSTRWLADFPRRCPRAPEDADVDIEIRQLLYGDYRILFTIEDDVVGILHVRHGARRSMAPDEL